ncbi:hypothetical protein INR49_027337 [Caranx melampygus]|nr:hypothetical protein INR49_027337 [Caranx melampygus]
MAVSRGGVAFWVGCIRSHGRRQAIQKQSWTLSQAFDWLWIRQTRPLSSASWALAPPNSLRYQNVKQPVLSHPFHNASQPQRGAYFEEDWEEALGVCVLVRQGEADGLHTLLEIPLFGHNKLGELLALGPHKSSDFSFALTTVDGRREDDISMDSFRRNSADAVKREHGCFRSLFEAERCPAPFMYGSQFYCFHCPGTEPLPNFFIKNHDYSMYSSDVEFINGLMNTKTRGRVLYQLTLSLWRLLCLCYYAEARLEVLKLTKHMEDGTIKARWRIRGLPVHSLLLRFYRKDKSHLYRSYDAFSTFYIGQDGLIHCHKVEKMMMVRHECVCGAGYTLTLVRSSGLSSSPCRLFGAVTGRTPAVGQLLPTAPPQEPLPPPVPLGPQWNTDECPLMRWCCLQGPLPSPRSQLT